MTEFKERENPMKVINKKFLDTHRKVIMGSCPNPECEGKNLDQDYHLWEYMNYCPVCGQKLDWSDNNEKENVA